MQLADLGVQLRLNAAALADGRQLDRDDVLVQIGLGIDPHRVRKIERHRRELLPQRRRKRQPRGHVAAHVGDEVSAIVGRQLEVVQRADVHRHLWCFEVQEGGVETGQLIHAAMLVQ